MISVPKVQWRELKKPIYYYEPTVQLPCLRCMYLRIRRTVILRIRAILLLPIIQHSGDTFAFRQS